MWMMCGKRRRTNRTESYRTLTDQQTANWLKSRWWRNPWTVRNRTRPPIRRNRSRYTHTHTETFSFIFFFSYEIQYTNCSFYTYTNTITNWVCVYLNKEQFQLKILTNDRNTCTITCTLSSSEMYAKSARKLLCFVRFYRFFADFRILRIWMLFIFGS